MYRCIIYVHICVLIPEPPHTRLYREHTTVIGGVHVKDLARLNRDLAKTVIVDNSPESYALQVEKFGFRA